MSDVFTLVLSCRYGLMARRHVVPISQIFVCFDDLYHASRNRGTEISEDMDRTSQSHTSATALVTFLNSHSSDGFKEKDVQWLFQIPRVAQVLNRIVPLTSAGHGCVLDVDELEV